MMLRACGVQVARRAWAQAARAGVARPTAFRELSVMHGRCEGFRMMAPRTVGAVQKRSLFIQTEETPNPASLKFIPGQQVLPEEFGTSMDFRNDTPTSNAPLVKVLMRINGVTGVLLGNEFITVRKAESLNWAQLKPEVFGAIMDFYAAGKPAVTALQPADEDDNGEDDDEIVALIKELLAERIRPMVQEDGGDIFFRGFDEDTGIVQVELAGACSGCPSSTITLKHGVENMLMHYIPEITGVESVGDVDVEPNARSLHFNPQD
mmetsp:Transcript_8203/g.13250  ORF Transcript_8203/g.13250 Transcript_8203/m.13250 type:complete len:264 (+) Transcript_8203:57-848(+)